MQPTDNDGNGSRAGRIAQLCMSMCRASSPADALGIASRFTCRAFPHVCHLSLCVLNKDGVHLRPLQLFGQTELPGVLEVHSAEDTVAAASIRTKTTVTVADVQASEQRLLFEDWQTLRDALAARSVLATPLVVAQQAVGALLLASADPAAFADPGQRSFVETIASVVAPYLGLLRLHQELLAMEGLMSQMLPMRAVLSLREAELRSYSVQAAAGTQPPSLQPGTTAAPWAAAEAGGRHNGSSAPPSSRHGGPASFAAGGPAHVAHGGSSSSSVQPSPRIQASPTGGLPPRVAAALLSGVMGPGGGPSSSSSRGSGLSQSPGLSNVPSPDNSLCGAPEQQQQQQQGWGKHAHMGADGVEPPRGVADGPATSKGAGGLDGYDDARRGGAAASSDEEEGAAALGGPSTSSSGGTLRARLLQRRQTVNHQQQVQQQQQDVPISSTAAAGNTSAAANSTLQPQQPPYTHPMLGKWLTFDPPSEEQQYRLTMHRGALASAADAAVVLMAAAVAVLCVPKSLSLSGKQAQGLVVMFTPVLLLLGSWGVQAVPPQQWLQYRSAVLGVTRLLTLLLLSWQQWALQEPPRSLLQRMLLRNDPCMFGCGLAAAQALLGQLPFIGSALVHTSCCGVLLGLVLLPAGPQAGLLPIQQQVQRVALSWLLPMLLGASWEVYMRQAWSKKRR